METENIDLEIEGLNAELASLVEEWRLEEETRDKEKGPDTRSQQSLAGLLEKGMVEKDLDLHVVFRRTGENEKDVDEFMRKNNLGNGKFEVVARDWGTIERAGKMPVVRMPMNRVLLTLDEYSGNPLILYPGEIESMTFVKPQQEG